MSSVSGWPPEAELFRQRTVASPTFRACLDAELRRLSLGYGLSPADVTHMLERWDWLVRLQRQRSGMRLDRLAMKDVGDWAELVIGIYRMECGSP